MATQRGDRTTCNESAFGVIGTLAGVFLTFALLASQQVVSPGISWTGDNDARISTTWLQPPER